MSAVRGRPSWGSEQLPFDDLDLPLSQRGGDYPVEIERKWLSHRVDPESSRAQATACSRLISRPSAQAASKADSPSADRAEERPRSTLSRVCGLLGVPTASRTCVAALISRAARAGCP